MWTEQELANKIDDEGGLGSFLMWGGLRDEDVPEGVRFNYFQTMRAWREFKEAGDALMAQLPDPWLD